MKNAKDIIIKQDNKIIDALKQLNSSMERLLICVDDKKTLQGVVNDGDIRRALMNGAALDSRIKDHMQRTPLFVSQQCDFHEAMRLMSKRVNVLPVIDHDNRVTGYYSYRDKEEFIDIKMREITIVGMGYVGLTLAIALSDIGFNVSGFDSNANLVKKLKKGKTHFYEQGLQKYMDHLMGKQIRMATKIEEVRGSVYIVTVGTPMIKPQMVPNKQHALDALKGIGKVLKHGDLVILRSTVPIGFCRNEAIPALEKASGLKVGKDFYLAYAFERTTEGRALKELRTNPQIIGGYDGKSTELAARLFNCLTHSVIDVESLEAAEMCKLIDNSFRDHLFAFINQIVPLAEDLKLDLCKIVDAVNHGYHRNSVPKPSPGVGGACLSKDPYILNVAFQERGLDSTLITGARKINESGPMHVKKKLERMLKSVKKDIRTARIFIVGLAFKGNPVTSDLRESTSLWFLDLLPNKKNICAYDPVVDEEAIRQLGIEPVTLPQGFKGADAVIFLNNHQSYLDIDVFQMTKRMNAPAVFIDTWHLFEPFDLKRLPGVLYGGVGND